MKPRTPIDSSPDRRDTQAQFDALQRMTVTALRVRHREVVGTPSRSSSRRFLIYRITWELQAQQEGGLADRARQRAREIAKDAPIRVRSWKQPPPSGRGFSPECSAQGPVSSTRDDRLPMPGALLVREYGGQTIVAKVLDNGFEYNREVFPSLSALAFHITGTKWNGLLFFGLTKLNPSGKATSRHPKGGRHARR